MRRLSFIPWAAKPTSGGEASSSSPATSISVDSPKMAAATGRKKMTAGSIDELSASSPGTPSPLVRRGKGQARHNQYPETDSMNLEMQEQVETWIDDCVGGRSGLLPCAEILVSHRGKLVCDYKHRGNNNTTEGDIVYRMFSLAQPVVAALAFTLFEEGKFQLDQPVHKFLGSKWSKENMRVVNIEQSTLQGRLVTGPCARDITLHHLFTHTSGLASNSTLTSIPVVDECYTKAGLGPLDDKNGGVSSLQEFVDRLSALPLLFTPGDKWEFSCSMEVVARILELLSKQSLEDLAHERIFSALGMHNTSFGLQQQDENKRVVCGVYSAEGTVDVPMPRYASASAGLISTRLDFFAFASMLARGGLGLNGQRVLGPKTVEWMTSNHLFDANRGNGAVKLTVVDMRASPNVVFSSGYGMGYGAAVYLGEDESRAGEWTWTAPSMATFWIDFKQQVVCVFMTSSLEQIEVGDKLRRLVYGTLEDYTPTPSRAGSTLLSNGGAGFS